jgi:bifunctional non-homologous end joining protein LigD
MPGNSPSFAPFQFCRLVKAPPEGDRWIHEVKFDGYCKQLRVDVGEVSWRTRSLHDWSPQLGALTRALPDLPDGIFDGELCAIGANGLPNFSLLRSAIGRGHVADLVFYVFDCPWLVGQDVSDLPLERRKELLEQVIHGTDPTPLLRLVGRLPGPGRERGNPSTA